MEVKKSTQAHILESAEKVFLERGLFDTVMDDIATESGLTRRTLYRYFSTKEELAFETVTRLLGQWNDAQHRIFSRLTGQGIDKLEQFLKQMVVELASKAPVMRFLGEFDFFFKDSSTFQPPEELQHRYFEQAEISDKLILSILKEGISDGSIQTEFDVEQIEATISNMLWTFGQRVAIRFEAMETEFGMSPLDMFAIQIDLYIKALRAPDQKLN